MMIIIVLYVVVILLFYQSLLRAQLRGCGNIIFQHTPSTRGDHRINPPPVLLALSSFAQQSHNSRSSE